MFKNTMAVGPLDPAAFCVTGGTGVANDRVREARSFASQGPRRGEACRGVHATAPAALRERCATE